MSSMCVIQRWFVESLFLDHHVTLLDGLFWEPPICVYVYMLWFHLTISIVVCKATFDNQLLYGLIGAKENKRIMSLL